MQYEDFELEDSESKELFLRCLRSGFGFTKSCYVIAALPAQVTEVVESDKDFYFQCNEAVRGCFADRLELIDKLKAKRDWKGVREAQADMHTYVTKLTLWESFTVKEKVEEDSSDLIAAAQLYGTLDELATACGFLDSELVVFVHKKDFLKPILTRYAV